jgi:predicted solute-binding protein
MDVLLAQVRLSAQLAWIVSISKTKTSASSAPECCIASNASVISSVLFATRDTSRAMESADFARKSSQAVIHAYQSQFAACVNQDFTLTITKSVPHAQ